MDRLTTMEAFVRVVDAGSFSAAARQWNVSKAAISKYVSALEAHLGVALLRRTTRAVRVTDAGRAYYDRCLELLGEIEALEASMREDQLEPRGTLRFTAPPGFLHEHLATVTSDFVARYPKVKLDMHLTHRMVDLVEHGFDVAIRVTAPRDSSLVARRLAPAPLVCVASPDYLRRAGEPADVDALAEHDCLVDSNFREGGRWRFDVDGRVRTVDVRGPFRVNSPLVVRDLAIAGHGVALLPLFSAQDALTEGSLVELDVGEPAFDWAIYAVYVLRRYVPGRVRAFIDHLAEALAVA